MRLLADLRKMSPRSCKSICINTPDDAFVFKHSNHSAYCYINRCPHTFSSLNWMLDEFMTTDQQHIICANHGALFRPDDGLCVFGPCAGQKLTRLPTVIQNACLYVKEEL